MYGSLRVTAYDWLEPHIAPVTAGGARAKLIMDTTVDAPAPPLVLFPASGTSYVLHAGAGMRGRGCRVNNAPCASSRKALELELGPKQAADARTVCDSFARPPGPFRQAGRQ